MKKHSAHKVNSSAPVLQPLPPPPEDGTTVGVGSGSGSSLTTGAGGVVSMKLNERIIFWIERIITPDYAVLICIKRTQLVAVHNKSLAQVVAFAYIVELIFTINPHRSITPVK